MPIQLLVNQYTLKFDEMEKFVLLQHLKGNKPRDVRDAKVLDEFIKVLEGGAR